MMSLQHLEQVVVGAEVVAEGFVGPVEGLDMMLVEGLSVPVEGVAEVLVIV